MHHQLEYYETLQAVLYTCEKHMYPSYSVSFEWRVYGAGKCDRL